MLEEKDFFISYHEADSEWAEWIAYQLEAKGYSCIIQAWDFRPGSSLTLETHKALQQTKRILMVLSPDYLDTVDTHQAEWAAIFTKDPSGSKGILLPVRIRECNPSGLLAPFIYIDLVKLVGSAALKTLLEGVQRTRLKPSQSPPYPGQPPIFPGPPNILVASLGDSPVVIPSIYRFLTEKKLLSIDQVVILHPSSKDVQMACELINTFFPDKQKLRYESMGFNDADSWLNICLFLQRLVNLLDHYQKQGEAVYLSLTGGRKSMAALMAWVVPLFSCIKGLYHVIDEQEESFRSAYEIQTKSFSVQYQLMHPDLDQLTLIEIPFERSQHSYEMFLSRLLSSRPTDYEKAEAIITGQTILQKGDVQNVFLTALATEQFRKLCEKDGDCAHKVRNGLLEMSKVAALQPYKTDPLSEPFRGKVLHYFTGLSVPIRPVFYTLPEDPDAQVEQVVVCSLEEPDTNDYKTLKEVKKSPNFAQSYKVYAPIDVLPPVPSPVNSVLIVPLGQSPMVATQIYTLLREQEQHTIHEVVLIYPQLSTEIDNGARMIRKALQEQYGVSCFFIRIPDLNDITSGDDCRKYQAHLVVEIDLIRQRYPNYKIDLALSGGRKGMTAMTIFAAQKNNIPYVYHTLITDDTKSVEIEEDTTIEALTGLDKKTRNARLFLHEYKTEGYNPYANFTLFRVPVFTADGW